MRTVADFLPRLWANWITLLGSIIATLSGIALFIFGLLETLATRINPYSGGLLIILLPTLFIIGLLIVPFGFWIDRRKRRKIASGGTAVDDTIEKAFTMAISDPKARFRILFVVLFTFINVVLVAIGAHGAVTYMDSPKFCGPVCHTPMEPEWTAFQRSPHNKVECVQCHIGPGPGALAMAKINGLNQMIGVIADNYHRPVPAPIAHMRTTEETCENCHSRSRFIGDQMKLTPHYNPDKENSAAFNVMLTHVGGKDPRSGKYTGIHSHSAPNREIKYEYLDDKRTRIGKITVVEDGQVKAVYDPPASLAKDKVLGERKMECVDCHNRPTHKFDGTAKQAVEHAMWEGRLDPKLPYIAKVATDLLQKANVPRELSGQHFPKAIADEYATLDVKPTREQLAAAGQAVSEIYLRNIFPKMKVTWNTYPDLAGHYSENDSESTGCMRCHDSDRVARLADGKTKSMDRSCDLCHDQVVTEKAPAAFEDAVKQAVGIPLD